MSITLNRSKFNNPFLSKKGQQERAENVKNYLTTAASNLTFGLVKKPEQNKDFKAQSVIEKVGQFAVDKPAVVALGGAVLASPTVAYAASAELATGAGKLALKTGSNVINYATSSPLAAVKTIAGGAFVAGGGLALAGPLYRGTKRATEKTVEIFEDPSKFTKEDLPAIGDSLGSAVGAGLIGAGLGAGALAVANALDGSATPINAPDIPAVPLSVTPTSGTAVPLTSQTQILGKEASSTALKKRKIAKKKRTSNAVNVRITNQQLNIQGARRIAYGN